MLNTQRHGDERMMVVWSKEVQKGCGKREYEREDN
jgi:hypothetical protein